MVTLTELYDAALLDLDGVVYVGDAAVPGAAAGIAAARAAGMAMAFVTNNASRSPEDVAAQLEAMGVGAAPGDVVTSAQAGARLLADAVAPQSLVLAVGGPGVSEALVQVGLTGVRAGDPRCSEVVGVLQGFGRDVGWADLAAAAFAVQRGAVWVATNPDLTLPLPEGRAPGNGSLVRAVEAAAGRPPDAIAGKPYPALMRESLERLGAQAPLAVGDRLDTDMAGATQAGIPSLVVFTGIADIAAVLAAPQGARPDYLGADLGALTAPALPTGGAFGPRRSGGWWECGSARASAREGTLRVEPGGESWLVALQAACAAAWGEPGAVEVDAAAALLERARRTVGG